MKKQPLTSGWTLRAVNDRSAVPSNLRDRTFPAWVPSCVHTVLLKHGAIDDPYLRDNESRLHWIGESDWEYRCVFDADGELFDHERIDFCFDGLDTIATIRLNDREIGRGENMHVAYRFDARPALRKGRNKLVITFQSPLTYARHWEKTLGPLPRSNGDGGPFNFIRKMACNFGWDWGPVCVTSGVWKEVRLEGWSDVRIAGMTLRWFNYSDAQLNVYTHLEYANDSRRRDDFFLEADLYGPDGNVVDYDNGCADTVLSADEISMIFNVPAPMIWQPAGHGDQPLYRISLKLNDPKLDPPTEDHPFGNAEFQVGLRTVQLDTAPDDIGREFVLRVNGKPIFCKGFNWIPDDCFLDRHVSRERYRKRIQQALDCGCNMLRVWGGGIYETDEFYDLCDEMGMMVWQDFPFACAMYPEEEPFKSLVEQEVRQNVVRLSSHPSLMLWNGNNENLISYRTWGNPTWSKQVAGRTWGRGYYFDLLPRLMAECDPSRPYWPASPYSGDPDVDHGIDPNSPDHGNMHLWEVWHGQGDYTNYRNFIPRFCSEFGYQAPANWATFEEAIGAENMVRGNKLFEVHQKSPGGDARNERLLTKDFEIDGLSYDDLHYLLQLNQARALTTGVEWFRANSPRCMGSLIWQFNDCYPVTSWSAIDSAGRKKLLWYAARRFHAHRLITIQPSGGDLNVHIINDTDEPWTGHCTVGIAWFDTQPESRNSKRESFSIAARSQQRIPIPAALRSALDPSRGCIFAMVGDRRALWFDAPDKTIQYPTPDITATITRTGDLHQVRLHAKSFVRDLSFAIDRLDPAAVVSEQLLTLFAGETAHFEIESSRTITTSQLLTWPIMNCANRFGLASQTC